MVGGKCLINSSRMDVLRSSVLIPNGCGSLPKGLHYWGKFIRTAPSNPNLCYRVGYDRKRRVTLSLRSYVLALRRWDQSRSAKLLRRWSCPRRVLKRPYLHSKLREGFSADTTRGRKELSGVIGAYWRAYIAIRSLVYVERSSLCPQLTSCVSCLAGMDSDQRKWVGRKLSARFLISLRVLRHPPLHGRETYFRHA